MKKYKYTLVLVLFILVLFFPIIAESLWQGPAQVLITGWGSGTGQIGIEYGDSGDNFPHYFGVSRTGNIVIADSINEVLHIYDNGGTYLRDIKSLLKWDGWPYKVLVDGDCAVVGYVKFTHTFNILTGELIGTASNMGGAKYVSSDCSKIYSGGRNGWKVYTPTGELITTTTERPLELGRVKRRSFGDRRYNYIIEYPEKTYSIRTEGIVDQIIKDLSGYIYSTKKVDSGEEYWIYQVEKYSSCGTQLGALRLPITKYSPSEIVRHDNGAVVLPGTVIKEYGQPVVAPNGDVYTWKRTPDNYSILKWTWQDEPNPTADLPDAPTGLTASGSSNGITLRWKASLQDPGCVSEYEIGRAAVSGGAVSTIGTVDKGIYTYEDTTAEAGTTYYYKVRSKGGEGYSEYSNEASGLRQ